ncbi:hypothetical protein BGZ58_007585 [Dissophora ornata]|nr:hypothetical protein BGZ58_007585 [Dissophora ornata]
MPSSVDSSIRTQRTFERNAHMDVLSTATAPEPARTHRIGERPLRTLIVDNYDSYTFNLLQLFDQDQLENVVKILPHFDQIILSPGPGRPERAQDFGICTQILHTNHIPVFGVCLGHQGIGWIHGAKVTYGPEPVHGQIAHIKHDNTGLFQGVPQDFEAVRYHSLVVQEHDLPADLVPTAWCYSFPLITADNLSPKNKNVDNFTSSFDRTLGSKSIMGIRHRSLPHHGVQFHPESICTQFGRQMMNNFFRISHEFYEGNADRNQGRVFQELPDFVRALSVVPTSQPSIGRPAITHFTATPCHGLKSQSSTNPYSLLIHALDPSTFPEPEAVFSSLFLTGPRSKAASWWLDSARQPHPMSRFSFMGGMETRRCHGQNPHGDLQQPVAGAAQAVVQYSTLHKEIRVHRYNSQSNRSNVKRIQLDDGSGKEGGDHNKAATAKTFWDWMSETMAHFGKEGVETVVIGPNGEQRDFEEVPFDFFAGMVGYFGYEMKRESLEGYHTPIEQQCQCLGHDVEENTSHPCRCDCLRQPDAAFVLATQAVVFDHVERRVYVLGVVNNNQPRTRQKEEDIGGPIGFSSRKACQDWIQDVTQSIIHLANNSPSSATGSSLRRKSVAVSAPIGSVNGGSKNEPYLVKQRHRRQSSVSLLSPFKVDVTEQDYLRAIQDSLDYIHEGESYELCLTTQFRAKLPLYQHQQEDDKDLSQGDPAYELYKILRKLNPAPFSAFLSMPTAQDYDNQADDVAEELVGKLIILSSSPERFLKVGKKPSDEVGGQDSSDSSVAPVSSSRTVEMKPIKGTVAVAKGCFCKEDEGCSVNGEDTDSSGHLDEEQTEEELNHAAVGMDSAEQRRRRLTIDRCAEARKREDQTRIDSLSKNIKERAENLMIVDLIRNDLAHVCSSKSVRVPYLMHVESYETVHQLVTTVRGELFDHVDNTQAVRACFPPGSMTGAPKLRSVQLLDSLEHHVKRGVYSGCLGYIGISAVSAAPAPTPFSKATTSLGDIPKKVRSAVDLAVVIRTAVLTVDPVEDKDGPTTLAGGLSVGAGGALTILSDANEEWREVLLKSRSVVPSVLTYLHQNTA